MVTVFKQEDKLDKPFHGAYGWRSEVLGKPSCFTSQVAGWLVQQSVESQYLINFTKMKIVRRHMKIVRRVTMEHNGTAVIPLFSGNSKSHNHSCMSLHIWLICILSSLQICLYMWIHICVPVLSLQLVRLFSTSCRCLHSKVPMDTCNWMLALLLENVFTLCAVNATFSVMLDACECELALV